MTLTMGMCSLAADRRCDQTTLAFLLMGVMEMKLPGSDIEAAGELLLLLRLARSRAEAPWASSSRLALAAASPVSRSRPRRPWAGGESRALLVLGLWTLAVALHDTWDLQSCISSVKKEGSSKSGCREQTASR